jgi:hypothetical protein
MVNIEDPETGLEDISDHFAEQMCQTGNALTDGISDFRTSARKIVIDREENVFYDSVIPNTEHHPTYGTTETK